MFLVVVVVENDSALRSRCGVELLGFLFIDLLDGVLWLKLGERNLLPDVNFLFVLIRRLSPASLPIHCNNSPAGVW